MSAGSESESPGDEVGPDATASTARTIDRRTLLVSGAALTTAAATALYAPFVVGDNFEQWVATRLGIDLDLASAYLDRVRSSYGDVEYEARASLFALATRSPLSWLVPTALRRRLVTAFVEPMFTTAPLSLAYVRGFRYADGACRALART